MKKILAVIALSLVTIFGLTACGGSDSGSINVVSRESGSGTRGAFVELTGIQVEKDGEKVDQTTDKATVSNSTAVVMSTVKDDSGAIGYISLGSLDDTVKAVKVDGVAPSVKTVKNGEYKVSRPFNIVTKDGLNDVAKDFVSFILSSDGQKVVEENGYISVSKNGAYAGTKPSGKVTVGGSSSVTPVMEKLKEAYQKANPNAKIEVQESDSSTGISAATDGTVAIGMASRAVTEDEKSKGLTVTEIAMDGIAVIVSKDNDISALTTKQIKDIYTGKTTSWADVK